MWWVVAACTPEGPAQTGAPDSDPAHALPTKVDPAVGDLNVVVAPILLGAAARVDIHNMAGPTTLWMGRFSGVDESVVRVDDAVAVAFFTSAEASFASALVDLPDAIALGDGVTTWATSEGMTSQTVTRQLLSVWPPAPGVVDYADMAGLSSFELVDGRFLDLVGEGFDRFEVLVPAGSTLHVELLVPFLNLAPFLYDLRGPDGAPVRMLGPETSGDAVVTSTEAGVVAWRTDTWQIEVTATTSAVFGPYTLRINVADDGLPKTWCEDDDGDGYGDPTRCHEAPSGAGTEVLGDREDCDDSLASVFPGAWDTCTDAIDNDCSGSIRSCQWTGVANVSDVALAEVDLGDDVSEDGLTAAGVDDVTGDGQRDMIVDFGARVVVFPGPIEGALDASYGVASLVGATDALDIREHATVDLDGDGVIEVVLGESSPVLDGAVVVWTTPLSAWQAGVDTGHRWVLPQSYDVDRLGNGLSAGTDLTGDGLGDVVIGREDGEVRLVIASGMPGPDTLLPDTNIIVGNLLHPGGAVDASGDLDGDGLSDVLLRSLNGERAWGVLGPVSGTINTDDAWFATHDGRDLGVAQAGDFDGDGQGDLLLVLPAVDADNAGEIQPYGLGLLYTGLTRGGASIDELPDRVRGLSDSNIESMAAPGDIDGDGLSDVTLGSQDAEGDGRVWWLPGPVTGDHDIDSFTHGLAGGQVGYRLAAPGDLDGDLAPDLLAFGDDILWVVGGVQP